MTQSPTDPMRVFDRRLVRLRRDRAAATVGQVAPVLEAAADLLLDRLDDTTRRFTRALDIGGRGVVAPLLRARGIPFVVSMDLSARMAAREREPAGGLAVAGDEEWLPFAPESFDLVVASLSLHWVNDLPGALVQIRRVLTPDGLFLASLPGLGTLQELREALAGAESELRGGLSPRVSPFPELRDLAGLLQRAGFALPVADAARLPVAYRNPMALFRDLRAAGETNAVLARDPRIPPRALLPLAASRLPEGAEGIPASLRLLVMTGWSPHESQSQPARPGSATVRLAEALGVEEQGAGETAGRGPLH
ncbi:methyltransferase domain-containing protein [Paracraurococcus lichenis]|uniref:Methyltransferase domain-containing protein n=1 Tax=Paracraurococcus lichenis TaxID=3064888 RepID=A0ABT9E3M6_9PROT|nr:methyltransferase domain-containing protein [Paracraurococcus sp. LOR1-02]MDO9710712.1 methyltransferase domain-containing protein [Paracraurococcus sp. LOR1-02]